MEQITKLLAVLLSWPVVALIVVLMFRQELQGLINRLKQINVGKDSSLVFDPVRDERSYPDTEVTVAPEAADRAQPDCVFTETDLVREFAAIEEIPEDDVRQHLQELTLKLFRHGIVTRGQLARMVRSDDILNTVRGLYMTELKRPAEKALDVFAIVTWIAPLFMYGLRPDLVDQVRQGIRKSEEYRAMH